jgi:hypothetical protein
MVNCTIDRSGMWVGGDGWCDRRIGGGGRGCGRFLRWFVCGMRRFFWFGNWCGGFCWFGWVGRLGAVRWR